MQKDLDTVFRRIRYVLEVSKPCARFQAKWLEQFNADQRFLVLTCAMLYIERK